MRSPRAPTPRWEIAPSGRFLWLAAAVAVCALQAPWSPAMAKLSVFIGAALAAIAAFDAMQGRMRPARGDGQPFAETLGANAEPAGRLRLTLGRESSLRLRLSHCAGARVALMAESASTSSALKLTLDSPTFASKASIGPHVWSSPIEGKVRGRHTGLVCGFERQSGLGLWRERTWQPLPCVVNVYPDLTEGRRALLESSIYRAMTAAKAVLLTGQGREFERLRDYQSGDLYSDLSWKATARRGHPVTRLFQWEQSQQIYFIVDHGRLSGVHGADGYPKLEAAIKTAMVGASAAAEVGDQFGLIAVSSGITSWLAASSGRAHFNALREALLDLRPEAHTPDFDQLFSAIKVRLRRRCYLMFLGDLTERGMFARFQQAATLVRGTHLVMGTSAASVPRGHSEEARWAADLERRRISAKIRELGQAGIEYHVFDPSRFLVGTIEAYLEAKRRQRL